MIICLKLVTLPLLHSGIWLRHVGWSNWFGDGLLQETLFANKCKINALFMQRFNRKRWSFESCQISRSLTRDVYFILAWNSFFFFWVAASWIFFFFSIIKTIFPTLRHVDTNIVFQQKPQIKISSSFHENYMSFHMSNHVIDWLFVHYWNGKSSADVICFWFLNDWSSPFFSI